MIEILCDDSTSKVIDYICNTSPWAWSSEMNIISSVLAPKTYKYTLSVLIFNLMTSWHLVDVWARQTKKMKNIHTL